MGRASSAGASSRSELGSGASMMPGLKLPPEYQRVAPETMSTQGKGRIEPPGRQQTPGILGIPKRFSGPGGPGALAVRFLSNYGPNSSILLPFMATGAARAA